MVIKLKLLKIIIIHPIIQELKMVILEKIEKLIVKIRFLIILIIIKVNIQANYI